MQTTGKNSNVACQKYESVSDLSPIPKSDRKAGPKLPRCSIYC